MQKLLVGTILLFLLSTSAFGLGNHPESSICNQDKPYQAICTHSLHNLEGWYGPCYSSQENAQKDADNHAKTQHKGNSRYTGIKKALTNSPPGY